MTQTIFTQPKVTLMKAFSDSWLTKTTVSHITDIIMFGKFTQLSQWFL